MRLELSIKVDYLGGQWGIWEGVRELIQNGRDAEMQDGAKLSVTYKNEKLRIENVGTTLPHEALLLGFSTKRGYSELIGQWGEGMKLGVLALLREGLAVKIRTGSEVWVPSIEASQTYGGAEVLVFNISKGRKHRDRVRVEIGPIDQQAWDIYRAKFLFLSASPKRVETKYGSLLTDPKYQGQLFVKGILTDKCSSTYGYDLNLSLDRDRRVVDRYDLRNALTRVWITATKAQPELLESLFKLLTSPSCEEQQAFDIYHYDTEEMAEGLSKWFVAQYGADAIPVGSMGESREMEHFGKRGIVVGEGLKAILQQFFGSSEAIKAKLSTQATQLWGWHELTAEEKANLDRAIYLVKSVAPFDENVLSVVTFGDKNLRGLYLDGKISLSRHILANRGQTLITLVHEVAHMNGGDGEKGHIQRVEEIWNAIVEKLSA